MTKFAVPRWQQAAKEMEAVRRAPPSPALAAVWDELDRNVAAGQEMQMLARTAGPKTPADVEAYATWLRWKVLAQNSDGRYSYNYAFNLHLMRDAKGGFAKEAAVFLYDARLALEIDGAHCAEGSAYQELVSGLEGQKGFQAVLGEVATLSEKEKAGALLEAVAIEQARGRRGALRWLCRAGSRAMENAMRRGQQFRKAPPAESPDYIGGKDNLHVIDTTLEDMELLPEAEWEKARQQILERRMAEAAARL